MNMSLTDYRFLFMSNWSDKGLPNLEALAHCYQNYKTLGVLYVPAVMNKIFEFDEEFAINNETVPVASVETPKKCIVESAYYRPKNFYSAQAKVSFKFINFIKYKNECKNPESDLSKICEVSFIQHDEMQKGKVESKVIEPEVIEPEVIEDDIFINFKDAFEDSNFKEILQKFKDSYLKVIDINRLAKHYLFRSAPHGIKINFKYSFNQTNAEHKCEIIFKKSILLGTGIGLYKEQSTDNALLDFHKSIMLIDDGMKKENMREDSLSSNNLSDDEADGAQMFDCPCLDNFYIKNNCSKLATSVLVEAFQYFKMTMHFDEDSDKVYLVVNNSLLASMPINESVPNTKIQLSKFVLKNLKNTKFTLLRNTLYINEFEDSVEKGGMYEKNLNDRTKIKSTTNIGGQLMLKMGWSENSGLGKSGSGLVEPIINESNGKRQGIGFNFGSSKDLKSFSNNVINYLTNWLNLDEDDIIFDRDFDNKERAIIHKECRKLGLGSKSYNNSNKDRFLVVSKNRNPHELIEWVKSRGGKTKLYTLVPPGFIK